METPLGGENCLTVGVEDQGRPLEPELVLENPPHGRSHRLVLRSERASATALSAPCTCRRSEVYCEIKSRCLICCGEYRSGLADKAYMRGLWSV